MRIEKGEGAGTISGFSAACTALANTVGTGNISGVATAIVSGGPGALVWMWVSAFFGMSTKACEIILGQRYSNDAGTGYGMIAHASAITDHPVRQSLWGWGEIFIDTMVICSITAFTIILTGAYYTSDATSGALTTIAFTSAYGTIGGKLTAIAIAVFAGTTIIGMYYTCEKSVNYAFGDTEKNKRLLPVYMIYYMVPCVLLYNIEADILWAGTDILSAAYIAITVVFILAKRKEIFRLFDDFWDRYEPACERGENPAYVTYDCANEKGFIEK